MYMYMYMHMHMMTYYRCSVHVIGVCNVCMHVCVSMRDQKHACSRVLVNVCA